MNTGRILYFPGSCCSRVFPHKTTRSLTYFLVNLKQDQTLEISKTNDCSSLVQRICERTTNEVSQGETKYSITFLSCTSDLNKFKVETETKYFEKAQIFTVKNSYHNKKEKFLCSTEIFKEKKCLDSFQQYYKDNRLHFLNVSAQKYKSMNTDEKHNHLAKRRDK